ncbi:MAG: Hsp20/alpha crystallin family protein [Clostridiales bacterium]|jgi:HSP20 family protein|nr:Hsp20/alpha crystallin family protein [Clostridiales bacterium]
MFGLTPYRHRGIRSIDEPLDFYNNIIDNFFNDTFFPLRWMRNQSFKLDLRETEEEYIIEAELAGYKKDDIKIDFNDGRLVITAEKQETEEKESANYIHKERSAQSMQRSIYLNNVDSNGIKAKFADGILEVNVPKKDKFNSSIQIPIQ